MIMSQKLLSQLSEATRKEVIRLEHRLEVLDRELAQLAKIQTEMEKNNVGILFVLEER